MEQLEGGVFSDMMKGFSYWMSSEGFDAEGQGVRGEENSRKNHDFIQHTIR